MSSSMSVIIILLSYAYYSQVSTACPTNYVSCADELQNCSRTGPIAYGRGDKWSYKQNDGTITCNDATFGDPAPANLNLMRCCNQATAISNGDSGLEPIVDTISCGDAISAYFPPSSSTPHYYKLTLSGTTDVTFSDCPTEAYDPALKVYDASGNSLNTLPYTDCDGDDCGDCSRGLREIYEINNLPAGDYYVGIQYFSLPTGTSPVTQGFYDLSIVCVTDSPTKSPTPAPTNNPSKAPIPAPTEYPTPVPTPPPTPSVKTRCGSKHRWCYYVDLYPVVGTATSKTIAVANPDDTTTTYFELHLKSNGNHCVDPTITVTFEDIDYASSNEYFEIFDPNNTVIERCRGTKDANCGTWLTCIEQRSLGIEKITMDDTYIITIVEAATLDALCPSNHEYSINAAITITCSADSASPTPNPTKSPTNIPSESPTPSPTFNPTPAPTNYPTAPPTPAPTFNPTPAPTDHPTVSPTPAPTIYPTAAPTGSPTVPPTGSPTLDPTIAPSGSPSLPPTSAPSLDPTIAPSQSPTVPPSSAPTMPPTAAPTRIKIVAPNGDSPTAAPINDVAVDNGNKPTSPSSGNSGASQADSDNMGIFGESSSYSIIIITASLLLLMGCFIVFFMCRRHKKQQKDIENAYDFDPNEHEHQREGDVEMNRTVPLQTTRRKSSSALDLVPTSPSPLFGSHPSDGQIPTHRRIPTHSTFASPDGIPTPIAMGFSTPSARNSMMTPGFHLEDSPLPPAAMSRQHSMISVASMIHPRPSMPLQMRLSSANSVASDMNVIVGMTTMTATGPNLSRQITEFGLPPPVPEMPDLPNEVATPGDGAETAMADDVNDDFYDDMYAPEHEEDSDNDVVENGMYGKGDKITRGGDGDNDTDTDDGEMEMEMEMEMDTDDGMDDADLYGKGNRKTSGV